MHDASRSDSPRRRSPQWIAGVSALVVIVMLLFVVGGPGAGSAGVAIAGAAAGFGLAVWAIRRGRRDRDRFEHALMARAAAEAASNERLALARDLHDLVSHGLGTITIRAAVARRSTPTSDPCGAALTDIETTSRQATIELRRMLTLLRDQSAPPHAPAPDDQDVRRLIADTGDRGVDINYETEGMDHITKGAWLLTYRVMQEALANIERHAGPTKTDLTCRHSDGTVTIEASDHGPSPGWTPEPGAGLGLLGLRERLESVGGTLAYGPRNNSGFRLVATFPDLPPNADTSAP